MRIKAFSLMELIVVIILLGVIFTLVLDSYNSKRDILKTSNFGNLLFYINKIAPKDRMSLYIYGNKCDKTVLLPLRKEFKQNISVPFNREYKVLEIDGTGRLSQVKFSSIFLDKKEWNVCFKLDFKKGKFVDKILLDTGDKYLLFMPLYQEVREFKIEDDAQKAYFCNEILPKSMDEYYRE